MFPRNSRNNKATLQMIAVTHAYVIRKPGLLCIPSQRDSCWSISRGRRGKKKKETAILSETELLSEAMVSAGHMLRVVQVFWLSLSANMERVS